MLRLAVLATLALALLAAPTASVEARRHHGSSQVSSQLAELRELISEIRLLAEERQIAQEESQVAAEEEYYPEDNADADEVDSEESEETLSDDASPPGPGIPDWNPRAGHGPVVNPRPAPPARASTWPALAGHGPVVTKPSTWPARAGHGPVVVRKLPRSSGGGTVQIPENGGVRIPENEGTGKWNPLFGLGPVVPATKPTPSSGGLKSRLPFLGGGPGPVIPSQKKPAAHSPLDFGLGP